MQRADEVQTSAAHTFAEYVKQFLRGNISHIIGVDTNTSKPYDISLRGNDHANKPSPGREFESVVNGFTGRVESEQNITIAIATKAAEVLQSNESHEMLELQKYIDSLGLVLQDLDSTSASPSPVNYSNSHGRACARQRSGQRVRRLGF